MYSRPQQPFHVPSAYAPPLQSQFQPPPQPSTRYRYVTAGGQVPNKGAPPGPPAAQPQQAHLAWLNQAPAQPSPPPYSAAAFPSPPPAGYAYVATPAESPQQWILVPVGQGTPPVSPMWYAQSGPTASLQLYGLPPAPPAYPSQPYNTFSPPAAPERPLPGSYVKGMQAVCPGSGVGVLLPTKSFTAHIVQGNCKPWEGTGLTFNYSSYTAACSNTLAEYIEAIGCKERAPPNTPDYNIGFAEAIEVGGGVWRMGSVFRLSDVEKLDESMENLGFSRDSGEAGRQRPKTLVLLP